MGEPAISTGWYPDPADESRLRWWDGQGWTEETRPLEQHLAAAPEPATTMPVGSPAGPEQGIPFLPGSLPFPGTPPSQEETVKAKQAQTSFVLGLVGIVAWLLPLAGFPVTIVGLIKGRKARDSATAAGKAKAGVVLNTIFLVLTSLNAIAGAYMGVTGA